MKCWSPRIRLILRKVNKCIHLIVFFWGQIRKSYQWTVTHLRLPSGPVFMGLPQFLNALLLFLALALLFLSLMKPWFEVPYFLQQSPDGYTVFVEDASTTGYYKVLIGSVLFISVLGYVLGLLNNRKLISVFSGLTFAVLFFPATLLYFSTEVVSRAGWMEQQHVNISWLGGDIYTGQEEAFYDLKRNLYIVDAPQSTGVVPIPHSIPFLMQIGLISEYANWFGYTDSFTYFVGRGWIYAALGCFLIIIPLLRSRLSIDMELLRAYIKDSLSFILFFICLGIAPILASAHMIAKAERALAEKRYQLSYDRLNLALRMMPILAEESVMLGQLSLLSHRMGLDNPQSRHYAALILEQEGAHHAALKEYETIIADPQTPKPLLREARRALLRQAIHRVNSMQYEQAYVLLRALMLQEPYALKANYALQLTCLHTGRFRELDRLDKMLKATYGKIKVLNKAAVLAFSHDNNALAHYQMDSLERARELKQKSIKP